MVFRSYFRLGSGLKSEFHEVLIFQVFEGRGGAGDMSGYHLNYTTRVFLGNCLDDFDMLSLNSSFICVVNVEILIF